MPSPHPHADILQDYGAEDIIVPDALMGWMRSNHAGETGAVWIYMGASFAFWSKSIRHMAAEHGTTERHHLTVMAHLVPKGSRSVLVPLWKVMGFGLGFFPSLFGYRAFCVTIDAVETFVEHHYNVQIDFLKKTQSHPRLLAVLQRCCHEEVHHQQDAHTRAGHRPLGPIGRLWFKVVGGGSALAVSVAKKV